MKSFFQLLMLLITALGSLKAQTPADNIMMDKGRFCGALIYSNDHWDHYWEGTSKEPMVTWDGHKAICNTDVRTGPNPQN
ncbi:MAG: hypothetical protein U0T81_17580 [Saprospiraceae bacterium]